MLQMIYVQDYSGVKAFKVFFFFIQFFISPLWKVLFYKM